MTNASELLLNIVTNNKPKMLTGLEPKGMRSVALFRIESHTDIMTAGEKAGSNPSRYSKRNTVSPYRCPVGAG